MQVYTKQTVQTCLPYTITRQAITLFTSANAS